MLLQFWQAGAINLKQMLENGAFPFADKLLQSIEADQTEEQNQAMQQGIDPGAAEQIYSQANPRAMEIINKGLQQ